MNDATPQKRGGCRRLAVVGCGTATVLALVAGALVWLNLDALRDSDWYKAFQRDSTDMAELRAGLLEEYSAADIGVSWQTTSANGRKEKALIVQFSDPAFALSDATSETVARGIAEKVAARYPDIERFDGVVIVFTRVRGFGVTLTTTRTHGFPVAELRAADPRAL